MSETQNGLPAECEMPQGFFKNVSVIWAGLTAWSSVTRFVTEKGSAFDVVANPARTKQRPSRTIALLSATGSNAHHGLCLLFSMRSAQYDIVGYALARNQECCGAFRFFFCF